MEIKKKKEKKSNNVLKLTFFRRSERKIREGSRIVYQTVPDQVHPLLLFLKILIASIFFLLFLFFLL
jgi:hypothetical protein